MATDTLGPVTRRSGCYISRRGWIALACGGAIAIVSGAHVINRAGRIVMWNASPSEPEGLYLRTSDAPAVGRFAAFFAPSAAFPYADRHLSYLHHTPIIKVLAAGAGSHVCTTSGRLEIDGQPRAPVIEKDPLGFPLPHWNGCRTLESGEWFAYSNRVPNSFDSRYYGPIKTDQVIAIYRPLWVGAQRGN